jgi:hypothetical protein
VCQVSDREFRALERALAESGSPVDELAYPRELVRTGGSLDWDRYQRLAELDVDVAAFELGTI